MIKQPAFPRIAVALDYERPHWRSECREILKNKHVLLKVGTAILYDPAPATPLGSTGWNLNAADYIASVSAGNERRIFFDVKLPDTERSALKALASILSREYVAMVTVSALTSNATQREGARMCRDAGVELIATTLLTDINEEECRQRFGDEATPQSVVHRLASVARDNGAHGVTCSGNELEYLKQRHILDSDFFAVTPGLRFDGQPSGGQKRVMAPAEAILMGSKCLVLGEAAWSYEGGPLGAIQKIEEELKACGCYA